MGSSPTISTNVGYIGGITLIYNLDYFRHLNYPYKLRHPQLGNGFIKLEGAYCFVNEPFVADFNVTVNIPNTYHQKFKDVPYLEMKSIVLQFIGASKIIAKYKRPDYPLYDAFDTDDGQLFRPIKHRAELVVCQDGQVRSAIFHEGQLTVMEDVNLQNEFQYTFGRFLEVDYDGILTEFQVRKCLCLSSDESIKPHLMLE